MTLPRLKNRHMEPPGGWVYRDLDTGIFVTSLRSLDDLISQCKAHRRANDLEIPEDFDLRIEASIAFSVAPELALDLPADRKASEAMLNLFQVNKRTNQYLLDWRLKHGLKMVSVEEAEERAKQCVGCKQNSRVICLTCQGTDQWVNSWTKRWTKHDKSLGVCVSDGIVLYATVHSVLETSGEFPEGCWKAKGKNGRTNDNADER